MAMATRDDEVVATGLAGGRTASHGEVRAVVRGPRSGKTAQLYLVKRQIEEAGGRVGWGAAWPGTDAPPLWHWRSVLAGVGHSVVDGAPAQVRDAAVALVTATAGGAYDAIVMDDIDRADEASVQLLDALARQLPGLPVQVFVAARDAGVIEALDIPVTDRIVGGSTGDASAGAQAQRASLRREADWWMVGFGERSGVLRPRKGLDHLAFLLARPGAEAHVLELSKDHVGGSGTPTLDGRAITACRAEWRELRDDLDQAEAMHDSARAAMLRHRVDNLEASLASALGRNGRPRLLGDASERARVNVTRAIRSAIAQVDAFDAALGRHLDSSIRTGTFCSYRPVTPIEWQLPG